MNGALETKSSIRIRESRNPGNHPISPSILESIIRNPGVTDSIRGSWRACAHSLAHVVVRLLCRVRIFEHEHRFFCGQGPCSVTMIPVCGSIVACALAFARVCILAFTNGIAHPSCSSNAQTRCGLTSRDGRDSNDGNMCQSLHLSLYHCSPQCRNRGMESPKACLQWDCLPALMRQAKTDEHQQGWQGQQRWQHVPESAS